ncbi:MAG: type I-B CRISPR-associated protein Cas8b1/Cst1 [Fusobacteriales bacterium]|jgi:CRISPR-associated protein Cst1|nr:type I-B CRISPR-associated protein Cas8b1/Cst1 [Fusobacteriales bacterium]
MEESVKIELGDWLFNAGITGLINILGEENINYIDNQTVEIPTKLFENFEEKYFNYFINKYQKLLSWNKIVSYEEKIQYHLESNFENFTKDSLEELNKFIGSDGTPGSLKYYMNSASYKSTYDLIEPNSNILEFVKEIKPVKFVDKNEQLNAKTEEIKNTFDKIIRVADFCKSDRGRKYLAGKNVVYTIIKNSWNGVCFLNPQTKEKDIYTDYKNYFLTPVYEYSSADKSKYKYNCFICDDNIKDLNNDISFLNMTGFDTNRKTSHVWNFTNDIGVCPVCKLVYSCVPAGMTFAYDKGIFINDNTDVKSLILTNEKIKSKVLNEKEFNNSLTYKAIIESINEEISDKARYELADVQVVRYENETYRFNILSRKMLSVIKDSKKDLDFIVRIGFKEVNSYFKIYELVIQRLFNNQNLYTLIHKLLQYKLSTPANAHYLSSHIISLLKINLRFLEGIGIMEKNKNYLIYGGSDAGKELKKSYEVQEKLKGISYRLLNALKTNNVDMFMDTLLNCYLYVQKPVPRIFLETLKNDDAFKTAGYAFIAGILGETKSEEEDSNKGGDGE